MITITQNATYILEILVTDNQGLPISGLTVNYEIYNSSSDSLFDSGTLTDLGNGTYKKSINFNTLGQFRILYLPPSNYTSEIETILVRIDQLTNIEIETDKIKYILGLVQSNFKIINQVHDANNDLISATIKIYPTALDLTNDTNLIQEYEMTATYDGQGRLNFYKVEEV